MSTLVQQPSLNPAQIGRITKLNTQIICELWPFETAPIATWQDGKEILLMNPGIKEVYKNTFKRIIKLIVAETA